MNIRQKIGLSIRLSLPLLLAAGGLFLVLQGVNAHWNPSPYPTSAPANQPGLVVSPTALYLTATLGWPQVMTRPVMVYNQGSGTLTWTVSANMSDTLGAALIISPATGVNTGTIHISLNTAGFPTGVFTTALHITAEPTTTPGSPFTIPVTLQVIEPYRVFLPAVLVGHSPPTVITASFGLDFITSAEEPADELRFQRAAEAGADWDRWPFYWGLIEQPDGSFNWTRHDAAVISDVEHGLQLDAILMWPPPHHLKGPCNGLAAQAFAVPPPIGPTSRSRLTLDLQTALDENDCSTPANLDQPVFDDGTDIPAPGKAINPQNPWASFVYTTVLRYKPQGVLAAQRNWSPDQGVRVWEVWNEPDYPLFWNGTYTDYARTVAVAFLAIKHADPAARVLLGGLSDTWQRPNWLSDTLGVIATYPHTQTLGWYFDSIAVHSYAWSWATWRQLWLAQTQLDKRGITGKTLWLNESGVPVWDDYPGPTWDPNSPYRATKLEQADYVIQSAIYALWMRAETIFHFQLYDDCGNGPEAHDAFGLRRNDASARCYPSDEGARPSFTAYQVVSRYLRHPTPRWRWRPSDKSQEWLAFYSVPEGNRIVALWSRFYTTQTAVLTATSPSAILVTPDGITQTLIAENGRYTLTLPAATNRNTPTNDGSAPIGGRPLLLIEPDPSGTGGPTPRASPLHVARFTPHVLRFTPYVSRLTNPPTRDKILAVAPP